MKIAKSVGAANTVLRYYGQQIRYAAHINGQAYKDTEEYITETLLKAIFKFRPNG
ncbi:MAG: helix-turn-helix domain-containing protein [Enterocloster asparagiformis]|nr:helix-turn-helix domain-containing protein [Enterocloster asparagiformis]